MGIARRANPGVQPERTLRRVEMRMRPIRNIPRSIRTLRVIVLLFCFIPARSSAEEKLAYYSDYFSFIGRDAAGLVALALDNNRA